MSEPESYMARVQQVAAYELVVDQIKRAIYLGRFSPGGKLPPERDLARQLGVSRTTIREAIRVLEGEHLVTTRRGATGGVRVEPFHQLEAQTVERIRGDVAEFEQLLDFRIAIEGAAARLAALRRRKSDLSRLAREVRVMTELTSKQSLQQTPADAASFLAMDSAFHLSIARAAGNSYLHRAIEDARAQLFYPIGRIFERVADHAHDSHDEILKAVDAQDPDAAERAAREHVETTRAELHRVAAQLDRRARRRKT